MVRHSGSGGGESPSNMTTATVLLWRVTGGTTEISMELWGSWISLVGSLWYSLEAEVWSEEM